MKTNSTTLPYLCPICEKGEMTLKRQDFETSVEGQSVVVKDVEIEICSNCHETVLTPDGSRQVSVCESFTFGDNALTLNANASQEKIFVEKSGKTIKHRRLQR